MNSTTSSTDPRDSLRQLLDADDALDTLTDDELKAIYVRFRLARTAMGKFEHAEIVDWLADPCDDYLGQFAQKFGLDVSPWTDDVVAELWQECIIDDVADEPALATVRESLKDAARETVGTPDAVVLRELLQHYTNA